VVYFGNSDIPDIVVTEIDDYGVRPGCHDGPEPAVAQYGPFEEVDCRAVLSDRMEFGPFDRVNI